MKRLAWVFVLFLAACATRFERPSVSLAGVDIESLGLFEQRYVLQLRVKNPNGVDIPVEGLNFTVDLNGRHFADGVSNMAVTIPRMGEAVLTVKASSDLAAFLRQWRGMESEGRSGLEYRVKGTLRVSGYGAQPFDQKGEVGLPKLPAEKPKSLPGSV